MKGWRAVGESINANPPVSTAPRTPSMASRPQRRGPSFAKGLYYLAWLRAHGIPIVEGATPLAIEGNGRVESLSWRDSGGTRHEAAVDAVALGWGLKPEAQLADLAGVPFDFDPVQH